MLSSAALERVCADCEARYARYRLTQMCKCRNSEIYNHKELRAAHVPDSPFIGHSDSELLGHWFKKEGKVTNEMIDQLDGIFAFTLLDKKTGHFTVARDAMGICPLYWGKRADGSMWFASEMKAIQDVCEDFEIFPPVCSLVQSLLFEQF